MAHVAILEHFHGQKPFDDVLEDIFGPRLSPTVIVAMGHVLWATQWAVHSNQLEE